MKLHIENDEVVFGNYRIPIEEMCRWWRKGHDEDNSKMAIVEAATGKVVNATPAAVAALSIKVREAVEAGFLPEPLALEFIQAVIYWGNVARVWGIVCKGEREARNKRPVSESIRAALNCLEAMAPTGTLLKDGQVLDARIECLKEINQIYGLGSISFSSKVARFLAPSEFGILDSLVANVLGVDVTRNNKATRTNLADYSLRLKEIANELNERKDFLATCDLKSWMAADVDLALWAFAKYGREEQVLTFETRPAPCSRSEVEVKKPAWSGRSNRNKYKSKKLTNHEKLELAFEDRKGDIFDTDQMWKIVEAKWHHEFKKASFLPNDHASGNEGGCWCAVNRRNVPLFENLGSKRYRIL
jgi:hypothetical protein